MSIRFPFSNTIGVSGCHGESQENCQSGYENCCYNAFGPHLSVTGNIPMMQKTAKLFTPQQISQMRAAATVIPKMAPRPVPQVPANGVGIL